MDEKYSILLSLFAENRDKIIDTKEISFKLGYSARSILRYISIINSLDDNESFCIVSVKNKGYRLQVFKEEEFNEFYKSIISSSFVPDDNILLFRFIMEDISTATLEKELNYSQASIGRMIKTMNEKLFNRGLMISRHKNTYFLEGNEIHIRNFGQYLWQLSGLDEDFLPGNKVKEYERYRDYLRNNKITDSKELQKYMFISLIRSINKHNIEFSPTIRDFYNKNNVDNAFKMAIMSFYAEHYDMDISQDELVFASLVINGSEQGNFNENIGVIMLFVKNTLHNIDVRYGTGFENDDELLNSICSHIASNISNYLLMSRVDNALLNQIRLNYTNEHVYALEMANALSEALDIRISDEDVGYLTLHFANCNEKKKEETEIDACIIYSLSLTTAKILQLRLNDSYPQLNTTIKKSDETVDENSLKIIYEDDIEIDNSIKITPFVDENDKKTIDAAILEKIGYTPFIRLCSEDDFYIVEKKRSKNEFLEYVNKILMEKGRISDEEARNILERESLSSTEIAPGVSFPHCIVRGKSFISIFILKQPIFWSANYVRLVMVMGYNKQSKGNKEAIKYLFSNLAEPKKTEKLIQTETFKEFIDILRGK